MVAWPMTASTFVEASYLLVRLHQAELAHAPLEPVFDARVQAEGVVRRRQVDLMFLRGEGGTEMVEVQHRRTKVGQPFVDQVEGKMGQLGVSTATLVSTAGFTAGAAARIAASEGRLRAVHARTPDAGWPIPPDFVIRFVRGGETLALPPILRAEVTAPDQQRPHLVTGALSPDRDFASWLTVAQLPTSEFHYRIWTLDSSNRVRAIPVEVDMYDRSSGQRAPRAVETEEWASVRSGDV